MRLPKALKSVKYSLGVVNGVFLITGLILLCVGIIYLVIHKEHSELVSRRFFSLPNFLIATSVIIFVGSILGFYGAISEKFYFMAAYAILMLIVLIFEIVMIVLALKLKGGATTEIRSPMLQSLQQYEEKRDVSRIWDTMQMRFECCGVAGRHDWNQNRIPVSCCHIDFGTISPFSCTVQNSYAVGCANALGDYLSSNANGILWTAAIVAAIQVVLTLVSGWQAWRSKYEEVELES